MSSIIKVTQVKKNFGKQTVLKNVSLTVEPGTIFGLLGANGAGKSTLLKIITGLLKADAGQVNFGEMIMPKAQIEIQRRFSFSGQQSSVDDVLTGFENLTLIAKLRHLATHKKLRKIC